MNNISKIFSKTFGCLLSIFFIAIMLLSLVELDSIIFKYFLNQSLMSVIVFFSIVYVYILRCFSSTNNKDVISFIISIFMATSITLIINNFYPNIFISVFCWSFCMFSLIFEYLLDRFLYKEDYYLSLDLIIKTFNKVTIVLFLSAIVFSIIYYCLPYFLYYQSFSIVFANIFEILLTKKCFMFFIKVYLIFLIVLYGGTFLLFLITNFSVTADYSPFLEYEDEDCSEDIDNKTEE